MDQVGLSFSR